MFFITKGCYDVGYEINKKVRYRMQFGGRTIIGGFNVTFEQKHTYYYKTFGEVYGFGIRK